MLVCYNLFCHNRLSDDRIGPYTNVSVSFLQTLLSVVDELLLVKILTQPSN